MSDLRPQNLDVPADLPAAWSSQVQTPTSEHSEGQSRETTPTPTDERRARPERTPARPVGSAAFRRLRQDLSGRDWQVIRLLSQHRNLTTRQLEGFCFADHATPLTATRVCRRVLRRLADARILQPLERRIGGIRAGSASYVWQLGPVGFRLLVGARKRPHEPSRLFFDHTLAIGQAHLDLVTAERSGALVLDRVETEPDCWRHYTGLGQAGLTLKPDLYIVTADPADAAYENRWFIEIDCGTENPARLLDKCQRYADYRLSGDHPASAGFPLVVWAMTSLEAAERFELALAGATNLDRGIFRVTSHQQIAKLVSRGAA